ncbi:MAG TPA: aminopeptidase [Gemmatimonadales bacterium]|nr:aminopeptidase [Gemmatimonadales bacterium]
MAPLEPASRPAPAQEAPSSRRRRLWRIARWAALAVVGLFALAWVASGDVRYLVRAAIEEARILRARRPIARVAEDRTISPRLRASLGLVVAARDYAARLGLEAKETYTTYADVGRDTLLLVLSAAPRDCLCPYRWHYPIVGRVPYKGFFDVAMAKDAAADLARKGYDVNLRPAGAFSTLGWFNDPLLSTALTRDSVELAATVFHEIAHNTLWVKGAVAFNESYAQYVGYHAAADFFAARGDSALARRALARWHDEMLLADYYRALVNRLEHLYALRLPPAGVDSGRTAAAEWARAVLQDSVGPRLETFKVGRLAARPINNARLIGVLLYRTRLDLFQAWHEHEGGDLRRSVADLTRLMEGAEAPKTSDTTRAAGHDPGSDVAFARLARAVGGPAGPADQTATGPASP